MRGQDQVFFFDVTDPRNPTFIRSDNPPNASITDEFADLSNGGFLVTFMGGPDGAHPGRVVEYDAHLHFVQTLPTPTDDAAYPFNPHGIAIDEAHNLMVTSDCICPLLTLHIDHGDTAHFRGSIRVWDLASGLNGATWWASLSRGMSDHNNDVRGLEAAVRQLYSLLPRDQQQRLDKGYRSTMGL